MTLPLHVVATAGHVDHGKSALVRALTGIEPDRLDEERRRGLTIDLGYAWCTLPSGREVGFVDVPGHERFVKNMLAGVGPVRLVLFVVAADEGWKPQSEEHLQIVDVLTTTTHPPSAAPGVVALTKADLVDDATVQRRREEIRARLAGTAMADASIVPCSAATGAGVADVAAALDALVAAAPAPETDGRPRLFVDRVFTIRGAGTVVTGTLTGGPLRVDDRVELYPSGTQARVRGLQRHERPLQEAWPVSRVAVNLGGLTTRDALRGDVLGMPGQWRPTRVLDAEVRPVRGLSHPLTARGSHKLHAGAAERDARLRLLEVDAIRPGERALVRVTLGRQLALDVGEPFVLREAGRRETVAGGIVLDPDPRGSPADPERLRRRAAAARSELPGLLVAERGAIRATEVGPLTGAFGDAAGAERAGPWLVAPEVLEALAAAAHGLLAEHHAARPLLPGLELDAVRRALAERVPAVAPALEQSLAGALVERLAADGRLARDGTNVRLPGHRVSLGEREPEARRLEEALRSGWPTPPTARELGVDRELAAALVATGRVVAAGDDVLLLPERWAEAVRVARELAARPEGMTAGAFRVALGTSRKYAIPLLERLDAEGVTRRDGDVRRAVG